jgi:hypothetical protein
MSNKTIWIIVVVVLVLICCCTVAVGAGAYQLYQQSGEVDFSKEFSGFDEKLEPVPTFSVPLVIPKVGEETSDGAFETQQTLENTLVPNNDPRDLAMRLKGIRNIPETLSTPPIDYQVGDKKVFNAINTDTNESYQVNTILAYETEHAYFWIQEGVKFDKNRVKDLAESFENQIYPTNREFFGSEWSPGIDNDPHLYIVYAKGLGVNIAGLYSSIDSIHPLARPDSNGHESFYMSADNLNFGEEDYGTLAHEFQHMIHWYRDRNEDTWMNEGFSVLAEFLNDLDHGPFDQLYVMNPDQQLTDWPNDPNATRPHYGQAFLFLTYFLDRFGENATQKLVYETENGLPAIDKVIQELSIFDQMTGNLVTADEIFSDWVVAMFLKDPKIADGRFTYHNYPDSPQPDATEVITSCPTDDMERSVNQYGVDYIEINCKGDYTLTFEGVLETGVLAENPYSGDYAFWSNKGDESNMTLTQEFDFSDISKPISFDYWIWYDLETDYDYAYLEYSEDGEAWKIIPTMSCSSLNKSGNSYGCGWNDISGGWVKESVDLSFLSGKKVYLRFEYITDAAVNGEGLMLDDMEISAVNYKTDFETDDGGWDAKGFVRIQNKLPQSYRVTLIEKGNSTTVTPIKLDASNKATIPVSIGGDTRSLVLVVSGTTRFSRQEARYLFNISK